MYSRSSTIAPSVIPRAAASLGWIADYELKTKAQAVLAEAEEHAFVLDGRKGKGKGRAYPNPNGGSGGRGSYNRRRESDG